MNFKFVLLFTLVLPLAILAQNDKDNLELKAIYEADQSDRLNPPIDWKRVSQNDMDRRERVRQLLDSGLVRTATDYKCAAMVFQHGGDTASSAMAVALMQEAVALDPSINKWLLAAAIDRNLMYRGEPQIYGTQFVKPGPDKPYSLYDFDSTVISDEQRAAYGVPDLRGIRAQLSSMNKKSLGDLLNDRTSVPEILSQAKEGELDSQEYDLSEQGINNFGYRVMDAQGAQIALAVFKWNCEKFPEAYNTFDSLGECFLALGRKEEAKRAYQKSLELNPQNTNAVEILKTLDF